MTKKGIILGLIVIGSFLAQSLFRTSAEWYIFVNSNVTHTLIEKFLFQIYFLLGLGFPVILVTQFKERPFYKYLGYQIIILGALYSVSAFSSTGSGAIYLHFLLNTINIISLIVFVVWGLSKKDLKIAGYFCLYNLIVNILFSQLSINLLYLVLNIFDINDSETFIMVFRYLGALSFVTLILMIGLVMYESKREETELMETITESR